ncbi:hypothetical protein Tco_1273920 [Tanacetum coccineum]
MARTSQLATYGESSELGFKTAIFYFYIQLFLLKLIYRMNQNHSPTQVHSDFKQVSFIGGNEMAIFVVLEIYLSKLTCNCNYSRGLSITEIDLFVAEKSNKCEDMEAEKEKKGCGEEMSIAEVDVLF